VSYVLDSIPAPELLVVASQSLSEVNIEATIPHLAPRKTIRCVTLPRITRGALETAYLGVLAAPPIGHDRPVVFYDNDTIFSLEGIRFPVGSNFLGITRASDAKEIAPFCYVRCENERVVDVAEKRKISADYAVGIYGFSSLGKFLNVAKSLLTEEGGWGARARSEFYMSEAYTRLLSEEALIVPVLLPLPVCLGSLSDIEANAPRVPFKPLRFCFDIDNTLVHYKALPDGEYRDCLPVPKMVELVRTLKRAGHVIILATARGMATAKSNLGASLAKNGAQTFESLAKLDIPYDEIYFGKPHADIYVDDKAYNPFFGLFEAFGMPSLELEIARQLRSDKEAAGSTRSNRFNSVEFVRGVVHKRGAIGSMAGEEFFYRESLCPWALAEAVPGSPI